MIKLIREDVAREFMEEFNLPRVDPENLTIGIVSDVASPTEIGKPPYKDKIERTEEFEDGWSVSVETYLMSDGEYERLTSGMTQYREYLEKM